MNQQTNQCLLVHLISHLKNDQIFNSLLTDRIDAEAQQYLHELEVEERLFDKMKTLSTDSDGSKNTFSSESWNN